MRICYYLTSHGFGHSARACAICECLPENVSLHLRTTVPQSFFREELGRTFEWSPGEFDCGCLQTDSITVDIPRTLRKYQQLRERNAELFEHEVTWLRANRFDAVVSDIAAFPLKAAKSAGIPSLALANFTWYDIYSEYRSDELSMAALLEGMLDEYVAADLLVEATPSLPMPYFRRRVTAGLIGRRGRDVRSELRQSLNVSDNRKLALLYFGTSGFDLPWSELARIDGWVFICGAPVPGAANAVHVFDRSRFSYRDVASSVDLVISKPGYCTVADCITAGVPLMYVSREMFAEAPALEAALDIWGHGYRIELEQFRRMDWTDTLARVARDTVPEPASEDGAAQAAAYITAAASGVLPLARR